MVTPKISKENKMADGIKGLVGKRMNKSIKFMGDNIEISKLSVSQVLEIQEEAKRSEGSDSAGFDLIKTVVRYAVKGGEELTDDDFQAFPMDELSKLSSEIMTFSGLGGDQKGK